MQVTWYEQSQADVFGEEAWLNQWERAHLSRLQIPKRRADWLLGRWTAKMAVAAHLRLSDNPSDLARIEVWPLPSGAPRLFVDESPAAISISLTHCGQIAVCALAPESAIFGCDIESIESRSKAFVDDYFTEDERAAIDSVEQPERDRLVTVLWSAKESALKALRTGLRLDTRCIAVTLDDETSPAPDTVQSTSAPHRFFWRPLRVQQASGLVFAGCWCSDEAIVRTVVWKDAASPQLRGARSPDHAAGINLVGESCR
jgi:4'-phosphopantetheinyl transferase